MTKPAEWRMCIDYRELNLKTKNPDSYMLPRIDDTLDSLMENTGKTHEKHRKNTWRTKGKHMEPTGKTQGKHRDYDMNTLGMKVPLKFLFRLIAP